MSTRLIHPATGLEAARRSGQLLSLIMLGVLNTFAMPSQAVQIQDRIAEAREKYRSTRNHHGYYPVASGHLIYLPGVPLPISEEDIEFWSYTLNLSEGQQKVLLAAYAQYLDDEERVHMELVQPLWEQSAEIAAIPGPTGMSLNKSQRLHDILAKQLPRANRATAALEGQMLATLAEALSEPQLFVFPQVRNHRARMRSDRSDVQIPGSEIDLIAWLFELHQEEMDVTPLGHEDDYAQIIAAYDDQLTRLCVQRSDALVEMTAEGSMLSARRFAGDGIPEELEAARKALRRKLIQLDKRIAVLNRDALGDISTRLPEETGNELNRRYLRKVYRPVHPDPTNLTAVYEAIQALPDLGEKQREDIDNVITLREAERHAVNRRMEDRYLEWREFQAPFIGISGDILEPYEADMVALNATRLEVRRVALETLRGLLSDDQWAGIQSPLRACQKALDEHRVAVDPRLYRPNYDWMKNVTDTTPEDGK